MRRAKRSQFNRQDKNVMTFKGSAKKYWGSRSGLSHALWAGQAEAQGSNLPQMRPED
jgi:hypothetical protein